MRNNRVVTGSSTLFAALLAAAGFCSPVLFSVMVHAEASSGNSTVSGNLRSDSVRFENTVEVLPTFLDIPTPQYKPFEAEFEPRFGKYSYTVSWNGIPAADASLSVEGDAFRYKLSATARTYSGIDIFYKLRYRAEGLMSALDLSPIRTTMEQQENSRKKFYSINFFPDGRVEALKSQNGKQNELVRFSSENATLDPFAAAFLARSLNWTQGETKKLDTFNGKTRYLITLTALGKETVRFNGEDRECWVIAPGVTKLVNGEPQHKLRDAQIYLTDDRYREVLKIVSSVFIGSVTTRLSKFEPSLHQPPVVMAQLRNPFVQTK